MNKKYVFGIILITMALVVVFYPPKRKTIEKVTSNSQTRLNHYTNETHQYSQSEEEKIRQTVSKLNVNLQMYGRVVDQDFQPIEGAEVTYRISKFVAIKVYGDLQQKKNTTFTNNDGVFHLLDHDCASISVASIIKPGYRSSSCTLPSVDDRDSGKPYAIDSNQPLVYMLVSEKIPIIKDEKIEKYYSVKWNEGSTRIPLGRDVGSIFFLATREKPSDTKRDFPWSIDVAMNGLDMILKKPSTSEEHSFNIAPKEGYKKSYHFESSKDPDAWKDGIDNEFFFITKAGHYAKITVTLRAFSDPTDDFDCLITLKVNRNGGRIFE